MEDNNSIKQTEKEKIEEQITKKVKEYKDVEGLTTRKLEFGLWFVEHRAFFKKVIIGLLVAVSAVSWSYTIYGLAYYIIYGMKEDELLAQQIMQTSIIDHDYLVQIGAKDLIFYPVNILASPGGKYDLAVRVQNINERWQAEFDYYFLVNGEQVGRSHGFVLPDDEKYLMALLEKFNFKPTGVQLVIENLGWQRINRHKIPDWQDYQDSRLNIVIEDAKFIPASRSNLSDKISLNQVNFKAINKTAYNYWQVDFQVILIRGMDVVGINKVGLSKLMSGQERLIEIRWPGNIGRVSSIEVKPELNILKDDIYIRYEGEIGDSNEE